MRFTVTQQLPTIPGFLGGFYFNDKGQVSPFTEFDYHSLQNEAGWFWLHLNLTDQRCKRFLEQELHIPHALAEEFTAALKRQYMRESSNYLLGCLNDFQHVFEHETGEQAYLTFIMNARFIITGRVKALKSAEYMRHSLTRDQPPSTPAALLCAMINNYPHTLDHFQIELMDELENIEDQVLDEHHRGERKRLMLARRQIALLHRHMRSLRRALMLAERNLLHFPPPLIDTLQRLTHLDQDFEVMEQRARFFHDEIDAKLAAETNRQLYVLSVLTAIFLPPTLVAGLFGMNLQDIPWAESFAGFWYAVLASITSSAIVGLLLWHLNRR